MQRPPAGEDCPCGGGAAFGVCCGPVLDGAPAATAEALMRSRYAAYAVEDLDHLLRTWHPRTRPADLALAADPQWRRLDVLETVDGGAEDETGQVEFRAHARGPDGALELHERSRFERWGGRWTYVDGEVEPRTLR